MKRSKQEIIQDLIKELSEASETSFCIKNKTGEDLVINISKDKTLNIEITKKEYANSRAVLLNNNDSIDIKYCLYTE